MHILLVDDEESLLMTLSLVFKDQGFEVETARSVPEATARLQSRVPDAVIVDKNLPDFSGGELVRHIRKTYGDVPVLLITAFATNSNAKEMLNLGVDGYLEKPFVNVFSVVTVVRNVIQRRHERSLDARPPLPGQRLLVVSRASPAAFADIGFPFEIVWGTDVIMTAIDSLSVATIVLDTTTFPSQDTVGLAKMLRHRSTTVRVVVLSDGTLKLQLLKSLIGAGVDGLAESPAELKALLTDFASR